MVVDSSKLKEVVGVIRVFQVVLWITQIVDLLCNVFRRVYHEYFAALLLLMLALLLLWADDLSHFIIFAASVFLHTVIYSDVIPFDGSLKWQLIVWMAFSIIYHILWIVSVFSLAFSSAARIINREALLDHLKYLSFHSLLIVLLIKFVIWSHSLLLFLLLNWDRRIRFQEQPLKQLILSTVLVLSRLPLSQSLLFSAFLS